MAGAAPMSSVGAGFQASRGQPRITTKRLLDRHYVCVKRTAQWREIVAEFSNPEHAKAFAGWLKKQPK